MKGTLHHPWGKNERAVAETIVKAARERLASRLFWAGVMLTLLLVLALNLVGPGASDPAGYAMAKGYLFLFTIGLGLALLVAAALFGLIRRLWFRLILAAAVYALASMLLVVLVASL